MNISLNNHNQPTPAKWAKLGSALLAASAFIATYGLTQNMPIVGYIGLGCGIAGVIITNLIA